MRILACFFLILSSQLLRAQEDPFFKLADNFFNQYIDNGLVKYDEIKQNPSSLDKLVLEIGNFLIAGKEPLEQKSFYTNAYNLLVIKQVVDNYPLKGPMQINGFFSKTIFKVAGQIVTLDQLEKEILFPAFPDPRLHFVLVCAAVGCPPLSEAAFTPTNIDSLINQKTTEVLNKNWYIRVYKNETQVSKVFDWYKDDFVSDSTDIKSYINSYRELQIPESHKVSTYEYDWLLNDAASSFKY